MSNQEQFDKIANGAGFIAALDQSGGSTPKALANYGVQASEYNGEDEMFTKVHEMRSRIITSPAFNGDKIVGAILFEKTMDNTIEGTPTATYLWEKLGVVPFLKIDKGLADDEGGVQVMKPMPELDSLLDRGVAAGIFGTKMRSTINSASQDGIAKVVQQQFDVAKQIIAKGLVPIVEPEVNINASDKAECEGILKAEILKQLDQLEADQKVIFKLTLPEEGGFYSELMEHPNTVRVVALSGGYSTEEACNRLANNPGMIASFSRGLTQDLNAQQSDEEFNTALQTAIDKIFDASMKDIEKSKAA